MRLKFIADAYYNGVHAHEVGKIYDLDDSLGYASRWIKRGVAVKVEDEPEVLPPAIEEPKQEVEILVEQKQTINVEPKPRSSKKKAKYSMGAEVL